VDLFDRSQRRFWEQEFRGQRPESGGLDAQAVGRADDDRWLGSNAHLATM